MKQPSCNGKGPPSNLYLVPFQDNHNDQFVRLMENLTEVSQHSTRLDAVVLETHLTRGEKGDCFSEAPAIRAGVS